MELIDKLESAGLKISLLGLDQIEVRPKSLITDELRQLIRDNKPRLMDWLRGGTVRPPVLSQKLLDASDSLDALVEAQGVLRGYRLKPAPEPVVELEPTRFDPPPAKPQKVKHIDADWHAAAEAYHEHHFSCTACKSAGQGRGVRCGAGMALWVDYQDRL